MTCVVRQALDAARHASDDPHIHERVMREVLSLAATVDMSDSPPVIAQKIHRVIRQVVNQADPYRQMKDLFNQLAMQWLDELRQTGSER